MLVRQCIEQNEKQFINPALDYCCKNNISSATDFKDLIQHYSRQLNTEKQPPPIASVNPLNGTRNAAALSEPAKSNIKDYETLLSKLIRPGGQNQA
jgi:hypothetical protein